MPEPIQTPQGPADPDSELRYLRSVHQAGSKIVASREQLNGSAGAYVEYVAEDGRAYQVRARSRQLLEIAKRWPPRAPYPPLQPSPLRTAYRWLALAALGLAFSGLGALLLAPVAGMAARQAQKHQLSAADVIRARLVVRLAVLLTALGAGLAFFFWLHLRG